MTTARHYDAIIIGAGQGGGPLAGAFAKAGRQTLLVERAHIGGTCVNEGCTPTKTMVASGRVAYLARRGADYGVDTGPITVDMAKVRDRKRDIVHLFRSGSEKSLATAGVEVRMGTGRFTGPRTIEIEAANGSCTSATADIIVLNTGLLSILPKITGIETVATLDSTSIMELDHLPEHLIVLGGGYIGLEFAQLFRRFGSKVTIVHRGGQLLPREDPDIAAAVAEVLTQDGLTIHLNANTTSVSRTESGGVKLTMTSGDDKSPVDIEGSHLLLAVGRQPNTDDIDAKAGGVDLDDKGFIHANARLETSAQGVYVLGDVKGGPAFTHISYDDYRILRTNLIEKGDRSTEGRLLPYTVFIDPQLGRIGLSETEARAARLDVRIAKMPMHHVARALEMDEPRGIMKAVVDKKTNKILGAAILGIEGGEIATFLQIAMMGNVPYTQLRDAIFPHPGLAESLNNLFAQFTSE